MAAFSTLALIGLGLAAGGTALAYGTRKSSSETATSTTVPGARTPNASSEYTGKTAVARSSLLSGEEEALASAPTSTSELASSSTAAALAAAEKARKRAAAGGSVLTAAQKGQAGPGARLTQRTLLGR